MDIYALPRMFREFAESDMPDTPTNIVIYVGDAHADNYDRFFTHFLNFQKTLDISTNMTTSCLHLSQTNKQKSVLFFPKLECKKIDYQPEGYTGPFKKFNCKELPLKDIKYVLGPYTYFQFKLGGRNIYLFGETHEHGRLRLDRKITPKNATMDPRVWFNEGTIPKKRAFIKIYIIELKLKIADVGPARPFTIAFRAIKAQSILMVLAKKLIRKLYQL